jgi:hypothetical protein
MPIFSLLVRQASLRLPPVPAPLTSMTTQRWHSSAEFFELFPRGYEEGLFIQRSAEMLKEYGFNRVNTIPCVAVCRDELCQPLLNHIDRAWRSRYNTGGVHFLMSSLAGMIFLGRTGMEAALSHAPIDEHGVERFVFYAFPHIAVSMTGRIGASLRPGRSFETDVCGALCKIQRELQAGTVHLETDANDVEQSLLKQRIISNLNLRQPLPSLAGLTHLVHKIIAKDLNHLIEQCLRDKKPAEGRRIDYAFVTGVQIHGANNQNYLWPGETYVFTNSMKHPIDVTHEWLSDFPAALTFSSTTLLVDP